MATLTLQSAEVLHDGRALHLVFSGTLPASHGAVDWYPGWANGVQRSLSTGDEFYFGGGSTIINGGNLEWHVKLLIRSPNARITYGESGITISAEAGLYSDDQGNATGVFTAFPVTNFSYVDSSGFMASIPLPSGAAQVYVSYTNGNDSRTFTQGQNVATPYKTLAAAQSALVNNGHQFDGSRILMLEGDVELSGGVNRVCGGASFDKPFVIATYWHDYGNGSGVQGDRAKIRGLQAASIDRSLGGGAPPTASYAIISAIDVAVTDMSASFSNASYYLGANDSHVAFIDCFSTRSSLGFYFDSNGTHVSIIRCTVLDGTYSGGNSCSGVLWGSASGTALISECCFDRNGYADANLLYSNVFCRNIYISESMTAPLMYWGGFNFRSGSEGVQIRPGGTIFGVVQDRNPMAGYVHGKGGRIAMCATLRLADLVTGPNPGDTLPRRWDYYVYGDSSSIIEQVVTPNSGNTNGGYGCFAGVILTPGARPRHIIRNTTSIRRGPLDDGVADESKLPASVSRSRNLIVKSGTLSDKSTVRHALSSFASFAWLSSDNNFLYTDVPSSFADVGGSLLALGAYQSLSGQELNSLTSPAPTIRSASVGLGDWYSANGGSNDADAFYTEVRTRGKGLWSPFMDSLQAVRFFQNAFAATNLPVDGSDVLGVYGSPIDDPSYINPEPAGATVEFPPAWRPSMSKLMKVNEGTAARRRIPVYLVDATDGKTPITGFSPSAGNVKVSKNGGAFANATGTLTELGGGAYSYEFASGEVDTLGYLLFKITNTAVRDFLADAQVVAVDPNDAVRFGVTSLPNANAEAAGGLFTRGTGAGQINQMSNGTAAVTVATGGIASGAFGSGAIGSSAFAAGALANGVFGSGAIDATAIASGAFTAGKFGSNFITAASLADGLFTNAKFATGALAAVNFANGFIVSASFADGALTNRAMGSGVIDSGQVTLDAAALIGQQVWEARRVNFNTAGSFGEGVASVTGNVGGSIIGNVGGSVGSVSANGISAASIATGALTAGKFAADAIDANALAAGAVSKFITGLSATTFDGVSLTSLLELVLAVLAGKVVVTDNGATRTLSYKKQNNTTEKLSVTAAEADGGRAAKGTIS